MTRLFRILFILFTFYAVLWSQDIPENINLQLDAKIPIAPEIIKGKFDNGLTYYIRKNVKPENRAQLHLVVNAGSVLENDNQQGLAHVCEHMAFNGTEHFAKQELINYLESIGMQFGPEINAYTSFDETVYMLQIPTDSAGVMEQAFQILRDWATGISFEDEEIDKERGVVIEEWRLGRGADSRMFDQHLPILYKDSRYAERLPIGKKTVLDTFQHNTLRQFYKDWYRPDLMAVVAVGDFDKDKVQNLITEYFADIPPKTNARERVVYPVPDHEDPLFTIATDREATRSIIRLYFKHDIFPNVTVADYRMNFVENIYNSMLNARLQELTQQAEPPFLAAFSSDGRMVRTKGTYYLAAAVKDNGFATGFAALLTESNRVRQFGFTQTELDRAKKEALRYMEQYFLEKDKTESMTIAREYTRNFLQDEPIPGIDYEYALSKKYIDGITLDEVNALSDKWLTTGNRVVRIDAPEKEGISVPTEAELEALFHEVDARELEPYVDQVSDEPLIAEMPAPGAVVNESTIPELDVTVLELSNGIKVYCKPTDFKNDEIRFSAYSMGGNGDVNEQDYIPASVATDVVTEGGVGNFDLIALQKKLAGKVVNVQPWIGTVSEGITGAASPQDLETMFQLIYLYITSPRKDTTAYQAYLEKVLGFLENRDARPETAYQDTLQLTLGNYHFRSRPWSMDMLQKMDLEKSMAFYKERFADVGDMVFFMVGNLDLDKIRQLSTQYLATLPSLPDTETYTDPGVEIPDGIIDKAVYRGVEPKSLVSIVFHGDFDWSKENQYKFAAMADILRIKLRQVVREDMSGTYGVRVSPSTKRIPSSAYRLTISFGCEPERIEELTQTIFKQLDTLKTENASQDYMTKVRETDLRLEEVNLKKNSYWLSQMFSYHMDDQPLPNILQFTKEVNNLTADDVRQMANNVFDFDNYIRVVLYPQDYEK